MKTNYQKFLGAISNYDQYCDGYTNPSGKGNYLLGFMLEVGKVTKKLGHEGSKMLDEINAFDMAERNGTYIGQINMSIVSSFCGPQGLIWGYDIAQSRWAKRNRNVLEQNGSYVLDGDKKVPVRSLRPMLEATRKLFGTVDDRKFPLIPGSHVPCAGKNIKIEGPGRIYSAAAVGMASNRNTAACLLMEDVGRIPVELKGQELQDYRHNILKKIAESVVQIGQNQECKYDAIYVGMTDEVADKNEIACALVAAPYFTLAKEAAKPFIQKKTSQLTLAEWAKKVL